MPLGKNWVWCPNGCGRTIKKPENYHKTYCYHANITHLSCIKCKEIYPIEIINFKKRIVKEQVHSS